jgi:hypothetical protein
MNKDHLEQLQNTLASLAFTPHFNMSMWAVFVDTRPPGCANACGTSLCLAGLATMLNLSSTKASFSPTVENLSKEDLYPDLRFLEENNNRTQTTLFYVANASQYLDIPYSDNARIWHDAYWPAPLRTLYSPWSFKEGWPYTKDANLNPIYQAYLDARADSKLANYSLPTSYFRALSGYLALETFYRFQDVRDGNWADASRENIDAMTFTSYTKLTVLNYWFIYYAPKITQFEQIALNTPSAQSFLKPETMVE